MKGLDKQIVLARVRNSDIGQLTDWINFTIAQAVQEAPTNHNSLLAEKIRKLIPVDKFGEDRDRLNADDVLALIEEEPPIE